MNRRQQDICREINYLATEWPCRRILSVVPIRHIYGYLWTVLLAKFCSVAVWNVRGWSVESFESALRPGDLVVGYPGAWQRWKAVRWPAAVSGVSSGGGIAPGVVEALLSGGLSRWTEIYGCTELGAVGKREGLAQDWELMPYWPDRLEGEEAPDELEWLDERRFRLEGRKDGQVEVSGMLVDLAAVRRVLLACPGVAQVALRKGEEKLEAQIAGSVAPEVIAQWMEERLQSWERPARWEVVPELRSEESGKIRFE